MTPVGRLTFAAALLGLIVGGALALFASGRGWQTVTAHRARPLADDVLDVSGRTLHPAVTGLAVVALAGVVGILATRGIARRIIGAVLVVAGAIVGWDAVTGLHAISPEHARTLLRDAQTGVGLDPGQAVTVAVHPIWPVLAALGGVLIVLGGALTIACGAAWTGSFRPLRASSAGSRAAARRETVVRARPGHRPDGGSGARRHGRPARVGGAAGPGSERRRTG